jgi:hypothetical protein
MLSNAETQTLLADQHEEPALNDSGGHGDPPRQVTSLTDNDRKDLCREECCQLHLVRGRPISESFPEEPTALGRRMRSWLETSGPARV